MLKRINLLGLLPVIGTFYFVYWQAKTNFVNDKCAIPYLLYQIFIIQVIARVIYY